MYMNSRNRKIISIFLIFVLITCLFSVPALATDGDQADNSTEEAGKLTGMDPENLPDDELPDAGIITEDPPVEEITEAAPDEKQEEIEEAEEAEEPEEPEEPLPLEPEPLPVEPDPILPEETINPGLKKPPMLLKGSFFGAEPSAYQLLWDNSTDAVTTVEVNGAPVSSGASVKDGDPITLHVTPGTDKKIIKCEYSCTYNAGTEANPSYVPQTFSLLSQPSNPDFSFTIPAIKSDVTITVTLSQSYPVWVKNIQVTDENKDNILSAPTCSAVFEPDTNTLKLTNADIDGAVIFACDEPVTVLISGENTILGASYEDEEGNTAAFGISSESDLSIEPFGDDPVLSVSASEADNSCAVFVKDADLLIEESTVVSASAAEAKEASIAVQAESITVLGQLEANSEAAEVSCGILCNELYVKNTVAASGGIVSASGADCPNGSSTGVEAETIVEVESNAALTANGGAGIMSCGLTAGEKLTDSGALRCSASTGFEGSIAIECKELSSSGMLTAESSPSTEGQSVAVSSEQFEVTAGSVSTVARSGKPAGSEPGSLAIRAGSIKISGGQVEADSIENAFSAKPSYENGYIPFVKISDSGRTDAQSTEAVNTPETYFHKYVLITSKIISVNPETTTVPEGGKAMLTAHVDGSYDVRWSSGDSSIVSVNAATGEITGVAPGKTRVTASAYLGTESTPVASAFCEVTVTPVSVPLEGIVILPESISLCSGNTGTLQYWLNPSNTTEKKVTWSCAGDADCIDYSVNTMTGEVTVIGKKAGEAVLTAEGASGKKAYCKITVSDYVITYIDNSGMWYYDKSDGFTVSSNGPLNGFIDVLIDGVSVPKFSGNQQNWAAAEQSGKTVLTFSKQYMASLSHGKHTIRLAFSGMATPEKNIYIQLSTDPPITGDEPFAGLLLTFLFSAFSLTAAHLISKKEKLI